MKSYNEMAECVLKRSRSIIDQNNKRRKRIIRILPAACGAIALLLIGICGNILFSQPKPDFEPLNYGIVRHLTKRDKTSSSILGETFKYIGDPSPLSSGESGDPPAFEFKISSSNVVAKAVEEYSGTYTTLFEYGEITRSSYRLFKMEIIDPLQSGLQGEFLYLLPAWYKADLIKYDALLLSMDELSQNFVLCNNDELIVFERIYKHDYLHLDKGYIMAFSNGIFDESLWRDFRWSTPETDSNAFWGHWGMNETPMVLKEATLEDILSRRKELIIKKYGSLDALPERTRYEYKTDAAKAAMAYIKPFENGIFVPESVWYPYGYPYRIYRRYIDGCPTNEYVTIKLERDPINPTLKKEVVKTSSVRFESKDFKNLPSISMYIKSLDLSKIAPQHIDTEGKKLYGVTAVGWYEKTEDGVYTIVKLAWRYTNEKERHSLYYDEMFILLENGGDRMISREELIELIGDNPNISKVEYGTNIGGDYY